MEACEFDDSLGENFNDLHVALAVAGFTSICIISRAPESHQSLFAVTIAR